MDENTGAKRLEQLNAELLALDDLWPVASELQWEKAPVDSLRPALKRRGERPDPTADIVGDPARQQLRYQMRISETHLTDALVHVRGVRRGLEIALGRYGYGEEK